MVTADPEKLLVCAAPHLASLRAAHVLGMLNGNADFLCRGASFWGSGDS